MLLIIHSEDYLGRFMVVISLIGLCILTCVFVQLTCLHDVQED